MRELLLGCGSVTKKMLFKEGHQEFEDVVRLDNNPHHKPDVLWDLTNHPLPFKDNEFDEIHAYEVLEHLAYQGDYKFFFSEFSEYWRILKPGGGFYATVPHKDSIWALGDPSHKRIIVRENLGFLSQETYVKEVGNTCLSDFRYIYKANFKALHTRINSNRLAFVLEAIK
jgi:SAM-dependent methyltransferase